MLVQSHINVVRPAVLASTILTRLVTVFTGTLLGVILVLSPGGRWED